MSAESKEQGMSIVGIEAINVFAGTARIDVNELMAHRQLDMKRVENLLMVERSVALPSEDPVSFAVNAAKPLVDALSAADRDRIELLITCSESGIDFGKSMSTYIHHYLGLNRNCRLFEIKQACYSGTAGFQTALSFVLSQASPGAKALVIGTDIARSIMPEGMDHIDPALFRNLELSYAEPSSGAGAVAMLISEAPHVFQVDVGANGYYGYEVMDTCRPLPDGDVGDPDLSLMSYLDCCENAFAEYRKRVAGVDYGNTFQYLVFHTPFGGMVKGAHRTMMRKLTQRGRESIEEDFVTRVTPGMTYCQRVGNIMGATVFLSLASTIANGDFVQSKRLGCFSYGSGCCSEFFSGIASAPGREAVRRHRIGEHLDRRYRLTAPEYDRLMIANRKVRFGVRDLDLDCRNDPIVNACTRERPVLYLSQIQGFHRKYEWVT
jgi:polyketide biosynthesis 3-hydroxy-3-methylglutaryl-CoA synthase-like enzyme PksG